MNYKDIRNRLIDVYPSGEAQEMAFMLMQDICGLSRTQTIMQSMTASTSHDGISAEQRQRLHDAVGRLLRGEPIQYILGHTDFCGLDIHVAPGVLIPRPETEQLVDWICEDINIKSSSGDDGSSTTSRPHALTMLDIGTGSGCIALALKSAMPSADIYAWDISTDALRIAQDNASRLRLNIHFEQVDALAPSSDIRTGICAHQLHAIVSNPPYICNVEASDMEANVLAHEPHLALFVPDDDPLLFYRAIARLGLAMLADGGCIYFETNRRYAYHVADMMRQLGYADITVRKDLYDNDRMVRGTYCKSLCNERR